MLPKAGSITLGEERTLRLMPKRGEGPWFPGPLRNFHVSQHQQHRATSTSRNINIAQHQHRVPNAHTRNTANMTNLDMLLLKGGTSGMTEENLAELRYAILTKGIPANSEGMVRPNPHPRP